MSEDTVTPHKLCVRAVAEYLLAGMDEAWGLRTRVAEQEAEIERLMTENWQLKGALGYEIPADIPPGPYKCGMCEARWRERAMSDIVDEMEQWRDTTTQMAKCRTTS